MMTNALLSSFFLPLILISLSSLLSFSDQQGIGSGGFSGGQRRLSPGSVALSALHCVWYHNVHLCHRCIDFLPVWETAIKATLAQGYSQTSHTFHEYQHTCQHITRKCKIITVFVCRAYCSHVLSTPSWKSRERTVKTQQESWCVDYNHF